MGSVEGGAQSPLTERIVEEISQRLAGGAYAVDGVPSERVLAEQFGVSRAVVRRALSTLETRGLVKRAPRCRTMARPEAAEVRRVPRSGRSSIGLWIWPSPVDPSVIAVVQGISARLDPAAYRLVMGHVRWQSWQSVVASEAEFIHRLVEDDDVAGALVWSVGGSKNREAFAAMVAAGIPLTFLGRLPPDGIDADWVGVDNEYGAYRLVCHLLALGHRRIAHVTNPGGGSSVNLRQAGYRRALEEHGVAVDETMVLSAPHGSFTETTDAYRDIVRSLMDRADRPTAIFAVNDVAAERLAAAIEESGLSIPGDVALAGFDGMERWRPGEAFLTTVHQPFERIGSRAAELLLRRIELGPSAPVYRVVLDGELSVQRSTIGRRPGPS